AVSSCQRWFLVGGGGAERGLGGGAAPTGGREGGSRRERRGGLGGRLAPAVDDGEPRPAAGRPHACARRIQPTLVGEQSKPLGEADHGFGGAQHQITVPLDAES